MAVLWNRTTFTVNMEVSTDVTQAQRSLNPEAPEFFPASNAFVSAPCTMFSPTNPPFLYHQTLAHPYPHAFSTPLFSHPLYPYPHQQAVPLHLLTPETAATAPVTEPVSSLLEPLKTKMVLEEEAPKPKVMGRKENVGGARRKNKDKNVWRYKRYGKEGFVFVRADQSQSRSKAWRAKPSNDAAGDKHFGRNAEASFEYPMKVQVWAGNNNREKHPPIPLKHNGKETTVMIKNIPNRYTREMLKDFLDQHCMLTNKEVQSQKAGADEEPSLSAFDFLYLPIDFVTKSNKGFAFVNFTNPGAARKFFDAWHDKHWDCFKSHKIREIYCAKLQGMEQLVNHFERMEFPSEDFQPLSFNPARDGSKQLVEESRVGKCKGSRSTKPNLSPS